MCIQFAIGNSSILIKMIGIDADTREFWKYLPATLHWIRVTILRARVD